MTTTYRVTKGQQYDKGGATVETNGVLYSQYGADGSYEGGHLPKAIDRALVAEAVKRVIASDVAETITTGEPDKMASAPVRARTGDINKDYGMDA